MPPYATIGQTYQELTEIRAWLQILQDATTKRRCFGIRLARNLVATPVAEFGDLKGKMSDADINR